MKGAKTNASDEVKLEMFLGYLLRTGVSLAALVSAAGLVLLFVRETNVRVHDNAFHGEPASIRTLRGALAGAIALKAKPSMQLGLMILLATPVARVASSVVGFALERDRVFVSVTLLVLALLIMGLLGVAA